MDFRVSLINRTEMDANTNSESLIIRDWFNSLEKILHAEAELAGLLSHGALIGSVREFFTARALKSVLPSNVHIGSGIVYSSSGARSKQVDIVIYDASFPFLESVPGQGLYFLDGVIATIEVKSTLNKSELYKALDNCVSVANLYESRSASFGPPLRPMTFVFAFKGSWKRTETLSHAIGSWWTENKYLLKDLFSFPETVVAGELVVLRNGGLFNIGAEGELAEKIKMRGANRVVTMGIWHTEYRFCWILMQLITACAQRASFERGQVVRGYMPYEHYWQTELKGKVSTFLSEEYTKDYYDEQF
jgi:hypothetical protein